MSSPSVDIIRWGRERARIWPWRGDRDVAFLAPVPEAPILSAAFLRRCLTILGERGFARVVTSALSPLEQTGFLAAGFEVAEELHLLSLDLGGLPPCPDVGVTRVAASERPQILAIDGAAFSPFWQLDEHGLNEALTATPRTRFRAVVDDTHDAGDTHDTGDMHGRTLIGYAINGRSGSRGVVQRLAVAPAARRHGIGRGLLLDGLHWMRRRGVRRAVVNTQVGNDAALALYYDAGFHREPSGLSVMEAGLR
jgi:ribosomal protein S18 acetylase RimI-like enzyme